jgi:hypothetical protein
VLNITDELLGKVKRARGLLPPPSNRGVTVPSAGAIEVAWAGVHWFSGTTKSKIEDVLEVVSGLRDGAPVQHHERGAKGGYSHSATCAGIFVAWGDNREDVLVTVQGEVCEEMGICNLVALSICADLEPTSRLDVAWDAEGLTPELLGQTFERGDVVTRVQRVVNEDTGRIKGIRRESNHEGDTVYLGSRTSERFLRVYDRRGPCRIELELKERRALELWRRLVALQEELWSAEALSELRAFIDFRDRSTAAHPEDCPLLPWWAEFCQGAERRSTLLPRIVPTLEKKDKWLRDDVSTSLALVVAVHGPGIIQDMLTMGRARFLARPDLLALIAAAG